MAKRKTRRTRRSRSTKRLATNNACCPIIKVTCRETYTTKKENISHGEGILVKSTKVPTGKRCNIQMGGRKYTGMTSEDTGKKVAALKKALAAKRCAVNDIVVHSTAKAKKLTSYS